MKYLVFTYLNGKFYSNPEYIYLSVKCKFKTDNLPEDSAICAFMKNISSAFSPNDIAHHDNKVILRLLRNCRKAVVYFIFIFIY